MESEEVNSRGIFGYAASGVVEKLKLGNGRWETVQFNNRLQPVQLGLGNSSTDASLWKVNFEYGKLQAGGTIDIMKNNGSIAKQSLSFTGLANPIVQTYKY